LEAIPAVTYVPGAKNFKASQLSDAVVHWAFAKPVMNNRHAKRGKNFLMVLGQLVFNWYGFGLKSKKLFNAENF
jgi:hypothetical protein